MGNNSFPKSDIVVRIGGEAGYGVMTAAALLAKCAKNEGLYVYMSAEYPSLIRGGHNFADVRISCQPVHANRKTVDILLCMNTETVTKHCDVIVEGGFILYDSKETALGTCPAHIECLDLPIIEIAKKNGGPILRNTIVVAAALELMGIGADHFKEQLRKQFAKKGDDIINQNVGAVDETVQYVRTHHQHELGFSCATPVDLSQHLFMNGNEAFAIGSIKAGCKFMASYPMTPGSSVLETMAKHEHDHDVVLKQTEDELAAANMICGASYAGVRAMAATSGGGFALMVEALGAAIQQEHPIVILLASRPGPGTGMATHTAQSDLNLAVFAGGDDAPRIVLAPGDVEECFYLGFEAFNYAEEFQVPVVVLTDKALATSTKIIPAFNHRSLTIRRGKLLSAKDLANTTKYKRYALLDGDPISPRALPGTPNGMHVNTTYEHDEYGTECEDGLNKLAMTRKRFMKIDHAKYSLPKPLVRGPENAPVSIISWGSSKMWIDQALQELATEGVHVRHMHIRTIFPLHTEEVTQFIDSSKNLFILEQNYSGQLHGLIQRYCNRTIHQKFLQYDGYTPDVAAIKAKIKEMMS